MKKVITLALIIIACNVNAQKAIDTNNKPIQSLTTKQKAGKGLLIFSGASLIAGSIISYTALNMTKAPAQSVNGQTVTTGQDNYEERQKSAKRNSIILYGIGGLTLAIGAAIAF